MYKKLFLNLLVEFFKEDLAEREVQHDFCGFTASF